MTAIAGHLTKVYIRADNGAVNDPDDLVAGVDKNDLQLLKDLLDSTDFKDTSGAHLRIAGLRDASLSLTGKLDLYDAVQTVCRTAYDNDTSVFVTIYFNPTASSGSRGYKCEFHIEKENPASSFDSIATCGWDLKATGLVTRV